MNETSFLALIEQSIHNHWDLPAMTDFQGKTFYYKDFAQEIDKLHHYFAAAGIRRGDKIALCGKNSANWGIAFFATLSYGAVVVSILHEFDSESVEYIVGHSESVVLFADNAVYDQINTDKIPGVHSVFSLDTLNTLQTTHKELEKFADNASQFFQQKYKNGFFVNDFSFRTDRAEELAVINYTSGTTSSPKGVMLPYRSLWSNTLFANQNLSFLQSGDSIVCMLPMAHAYGLAFEVLNSISMGMHIHFLGKTPSPKVLIAKFAEVKPKLVLAVPLIIEKIVTKNVFPKINKRTTKTLRSIPIVKSVINNKVRAAMMDIFGGRLVEVVIGGAALNEDVEKFLRQIRFPYTVGYGMTECGPLISYAFWKEFRERSCGKAVDRMQVKIDSPDPANEVGEIMAKGTNVMLGYYKNPEATNEVLQSDGWLRTGDLGVMDNNGFIYIKGRNKNMILGASGQNIYPEEIEDKLNNSPFVSEALVVEENAKIVALVLPDADTLAENEVPAEDYPTFFDGLMREINAKLPSYSQIHAIRLRTEEFEKTPKRSIKRFMYQT